MATSKRIGVTEASRIIGVSEHRVRQLCRERRLDAIRDARGFFRITKESCEQYAPQTVTVEYRKMVIYANAQMQAEIAALIKRLGCEKEARFQVASKYKSGDERATEQERLVEIK